MIEQHGSLAEKFLKKGFWLYLFSFIVAPLSYVIKIIASNELSVSEVGILYGIISLIILVGAFNDLGMSESLKHFVPKYLAKKDYSKIKTILSLAFIVQAFTAIIISAIFYFGADTLAENYFKSEAAGEALKIFAVFFFGFNILQTLNNFFLAIQDTFYSKIGDFLRALGSMGLVLFLLFTDNSTLQNFSIVQVIGVYIGLSVSLISFYLQYFKKYFTGVKTDFQTSVIKPIFSYALLVVLGASAGTILSQIDMQMVIYMLSTTDAGYYTNYLSIIGVPFMIIGPIFALLFPVISELHGKGDTQKIKDIKTHFTEIFISIGIMFNIFFFIFAEAIAYTLFGEKFINSGTILQYSVLFLVFNFLLQINFNLQAGVGKIKINVYITIFAMFLNIVTNIIFIRMLGVHGAALATGIGWAIMYGLSQYLINSKYKSPLNVKMIIKNISIFVSFGGVFWYISKNISLFESRVSSFILLGVLFTIWSGIFILTNKAMFQTFIGEIKKIKGK